jgi:hypothetical protein
MSKECKVEKCSKEVAMKDFCVDHYIQYTKGEISITGDTLWEQIKIVEPENVIRLPAKWNYQDTKSKTDFIKKCRKASLLIHIFLKDPDVFIKFHIEERLVELGEAPPKIKIIKCKIPKCNGGPNAKGHFSKGFCHKHYMNYMNGIVDINGKVVREKVKPTEKKRVECKVEKCTMTSYKKMFCETHYIEFRNGQRDIHGNKLTSFKTQNLILKPKSRFNTIVRTLVFMKKELREIRKGAFYDKDVREDFLKQVSYLDDNLRFINDPGFILGSMSLFDNRTLKAVLGAESLPSVDVNIELTDQNESRKFKGVLIKGQNANVAVTKYEIVNKEETHSETVFFLKDPFRFKFPFECEARDLEGNMIHHLKIMESEK